MGLALLGEIHKAFLERSKGQAAAGVSWQPLAEQTVKAKEREKDRRGAAADILVGTGQLADSLKPGAPPESAGPTPPSVPGQVFRVAPRVGKASVAVGSALPYAAVHHHGDQERGIPKRPLWPRPEDWPQAWRQALARQGAAGLVEVILAELRGLA
jgi:hypothetical protein